MRLMRVLAPVAALLAVALIVAGGLLIPAMPTPEPPEAAAVPPRTTVICAVDPADQRTVRLTAAGDPGSDTAGSVTVASLGSDEPDAELSTAGTVTAEVEPPEEPDADEEPGAKPYGVMARGALAARSGGVLLGFAQDGTDRGLAAQPCELAGTERWFAGLGATDEQQSVVVVSNPDAEAAEVELRIYGPDGPVSAPGSSGLSIPPYGTRSIALEGLIDPESLGEDGGPVALRVRATAGRVRAIVQDRHRDGTDPAGADWVTGTAAPAAEQVIPGIAAGAGNRDLVVVNPGERTTSVQVSALGETGAFVLDGQDAVDVPAGSVVRIPLAEALAGDPAAVRVRAGQPVAAAVVSTTDPDDAGEEHPDSATATAIPAITGTAVLPVVADASVTGRIMISNAGDEPATAQVRLRDAAGEEIGSHNVDLAPGETGVVEAEAADAEDGSGEGSEVVWAEIRTEAALIHAAVVLIRDTDDIAGISWLPAVSSPMAAGLPPTRQDPGILWQNG